MTLGEAIAFGIVLTISLTTIAVVITSELRKTSREDKT